jgi:glycosyltransferase involved in cell wall biosynthesis
MESDIDSATATAASSQAGPGEKLLGVSVIIPAFNEAEGVASVVRAVHGELDRTNRPFEVLVVDDASTDGTGELAREAGARLLTHSHNLGYGGSLKNGVREARHPVVLFYDADGQFAATDIEKILAFLPEYDMATGWRDSRSHVPKDRIVGKKFLGWVANWLARQSIPDLNCGFRAIKRRVLMRYLHLLPDGFSASTTTTLLFLKQGHRVKFVPTVIEKRVGSSTVRPLHHGMQTVLLIVRLITLLDPFRVFFPVSAVMGLAGLGWAIPYLIAGHGLSTGALFLMITSVMFFFFGLLADQVAAMRREQAAFHWQSMQDDAEHSSKD